MQSTETTARQSPYTSKYSLQAPPVVDRLVDSSLYELPEKVGVAKADEAEDKEKRDTQSEREDVDVSQLDEIGEAAGEQNHIRFLKETGVAVAGEDEGGEARVRAQREGEGDGPGH